MNEAAASCFKYSLFFFTLGIINVAFQLGMYLNDLEASYMEEENNANIETLIREEVSKAMENK